MRPRLRLDRVAGMRWYLLGASLASLAGCTSSLILPKQTESPPEVKPTALPVDSGVTLIKDVTSPSGLNYLKVESVSLVTGLRGTGSDPPPSPQRSALLADMQARDVKNPHQVLAPAIRNHQLA